MGQHLRVDDPYGSVRRDTAMYRGQIQRCLLPSAQAAPENKGPSGRAVRTTATGSSGPRSTAVYNLDLACARVRNLLQTRFQLQY